MPKAKDLHVFVKGISKLLYGLSGESFSEARIFGITQRLRNAKFIFWILLLFLCTMKKFGHVKKCPTCIILIRYLNICIDCIKAYAMFSGT